MPVGPDGPSDTASHIDQIVRDAKPSELPIARSTKFEPIVYQDNYRDRHHDSAVHAAAREQSHRVEMG